MAASTQGLNARISSTGVSPEVSMKGNAASAATASSAMGASCQNRVRAGRSVSRHPASSASAGNSGRM